MLTEEEMFMAMLNEKLLGLNNGSFEQSDDGYKWLDEWSNSVAIVAKTKAVSIPVRGVVSRNENVIYVRFK